MRILLLVSLFAGAAALSVGRVAEASGLHNRRDAIGFAATAAIGLSALPARGAEPDLFELGAQAKALRATVRAKKAGAKATLVAAQTSVLAPLRDAMLTQAPSKDAKEKGLEMKGHLMEIDYFVNAKENYFAPYTSKTTGDTYPGGKLERELEEVSDTFDEYVALLPSVFDGRFADPNHPNGYRAIAVAQGVATITGKDEPRDAEWTLSARVRGGQFGREMLVDFSPKGGPKDLLAKWSPAKNAIEFPDGNAWPKLPVFAGKFADPNHPKGYRKISVADGVATITGKDEPRDKEWTISARVSGGQFGNEMLIDFSPKGGPKNLLAKWSPTKNAIEFPDGNAWPRQD